MTRKLSLLLAVGLLAGLAGTVHAQTTCSRLLVSGTGKPGTDLTFSLSSPDKNAPAVLLVAAKAGKFEVRMGPIGTLSLGVLPPFVPVMMGATDGSGAAKVVIKVPEARIPEQTLHAQGLTVTVKTTRPPGLAFCTSNVPSFQIGGSN